jgi:uncharacterized membrane protein YeaQ/YmgE (transglycosylase-associated protein family)
MIGTLIVGALAGWLAGILTKGRGFGIIGNIFIGIVGAWFGRWLGNLAGVSVQPTTLMGDILTSTGGAVLLLFVIGWFRRNF